MQLVLALSLALAAHAEPDIVIPNKRPVVVEAPEPAPVELGERALDTTDVPSSSGGSEFTLLLIAGSVGVGLVLLRSLRGTTGAARR